MPPKRKFDKKNAVTFKIVNRGGANEDAQEKVWAFVKSGRRAKNQQVLKKIQSELPLGSIIVDGEEEEEYDEDYFAGENYNYKEKEHIEDDDFILGLEGLTCEEIAEIRRKTVDGMFPNDGYDYSKHIRDRGNGTVISGLEVEKVVVEGDKIMEVYKAPVLKPDVKLYDSRGNLIQAAEQEEIDSEEDFEILDEEKGEDFEDFVRGLNQPNEGELYEESDDEEEEHNISASTEQLQPVLTRKEVRKQIDDEFDKLLEEYTDDQIGELDTEAAHGNLKISEIRDVVEQFLESTKIKFEHNQLITDYYDDGDVDDPTDKELRKEQYFDGYVLTQADRFFGRNDVTREEILEIIRKRLEFKREQRRRVNRDSDSESEDELEEIKVPQEQKWDCESIISTYSNTENHPKLIIEKKVKLSAKTGIPLGVLEDKNKSKENDDNDNEQELSENMGAARPKDETPEEKKERKKFNKMYKKMMREQKKSLKNAFKSEEQRQGKIMAQPHVRQKVVVKF